MQLSCAVLKPGSDAAYGQVPQVTRRFAPFLLLFLPLGRAVVCQRQRGRRWASSSFFSMVGVICLVVHNLDLLAHVADAQGARQPNRTALDKALHVLAANQRNVFAEAALVTSP